MKHILQYGQIAGIPHNYCCALERLGISCKNIVPVKSDLSHLRRELPCDGYVYGVNDNKFIRTAKLIHFFLLNALKNSSLVHYHHSPIFRKGLDLKLLSIMKRPRVISFAGTDVRIESIARKKNPYFRPMNYSAGERRIRLKLEHLSKYIDFVITDCEMAEYVEPYFQKVFILPQPMDLAKITLSYPQTDAQDPVVLHVPTNQYFKGTDYVLSAIEKLRSEGLSFQFQLLNPTFTQKEFYQEISKADIIIDEILCGAYGLTSVEAMASGKPTLTYIRADLLGKYPKDLPIVNTNPDTIYEKLRELIVSAQLRHEIGKLSRQYVEKYHSLEAVGPKLLEIYKEIGFS